MKTRIELVTPEAAQKYLSRNIHNYRPFRQNVAAEYAEDMKNGRWESNGEAIVFDRDGVLKDGQHRLSAIVQSGMPQTMVIVEDVDPAIEIYDIGVKRTNGQIANASGVDHKLANSTVISAARVFTEGGTFTKLRNRGNPQDAISMIQSHDELFLTGVEALRSGSNKSGFRGRAVLVAIIKLLRDGDVTFQTLKEFALTVNTGVPHGVRTENAAPLILRRQIEGMAGLYGIQTECLIYSAYVDAVRDYVAGTRRKAAYRLNAENLEDLKKLASEMLAERAKFMEVK